MNTTAAEELDKWLDCSPAIVQRNVKIVTPEELGIDYFLHISRDINIRKFIPVIGHRQGDGENRTVPRICVAPTLFGCFLGYAAIEYDHLTHMATGNAEDNNWRGGWKIYAIPFDAALKPNGKMVYGKHSDEHWLVSYNKETAEYIPQTAGRAFYRSITFVGQTGKTARGEGTLYVEVIKENGIRFNKNIFLEKGYWKIEGPTPSDTTSWTEDGRFKVSEITANEYRAIKNETAALLNYQDSPPPAFMTW